MPSKITIIFFLAVLAAAALAFGIVPWWATAPINTGVIGQVAAVLEEKRNQIGQVIQSSQTAEPILYQTLNKLLEKYPQMQKVAASLPTTAQIQYRTLAILAFILKTPWALALAGLTGLSFLWKLTKIFA